MVEPVLGDDLAALVYGFLELDVQWREYGAGNILNFVKGKREREASVNVVFHQLE